MAREKSDNQELKLEKSNSEKAKIALPAIIILGILSSSADGFEFFGGLANAIPIAGQIIWVISLLYGFFVDAIMLFWSFLTGTKGRFLAKRIVILALGFVGDALTGGFLPLRTIVFAIVVWLNNHVENENIKRISLLLGKVK